MNSGRHAAEPTSEFVVCVPSRNEAERLPILLRSLAEQDCEAPVHVQICVNNSHDGSVDRVCTAAQKHADRLVIHLDEIDFPPETANAGTARRRAMGLGLHRLSCLDTGVLLTTDADARLPSHWISANLAAISRGADLVGGRILLDRSEAVPQHVVRLRAMLDSYWEEVREIEDTIDPLPHDPPPRHGDHTGASLAIRAATYIAAGGVPPIETGEDRALVSSALATGAHLAHPMDVWVEVSARTVGRAVGGMADYLRRLQAGPDDGPYLPPLEAWRDLAEWRCALRQEQDGDRRIAVEERLRPPMPETLRLRDRYGAA
ncbi:MAG: glycosyl transferase family 2 [Sphingobium sp.]|uniref:glycosyltransferase n=1 Tax=Sphingobium sp. TaxID=1912891 RepID=UPI000DB85043|nr:MAG: glycosyl transferase family 2 [Sphingobium sp.]